MQPTNGFFGRMKAKMERASLRSNKSNRGSACSLPTGAPVSVNVYDMMWLNVYTNNLGIGVYHTGVVVYGIEYCYGGHPLSYSGIFAMAPQDVETLGPNYSYKTTIELGHTDFTEADIALILEDMGPQYRGDQYHLLRRNCNHFSDAFAQILCGTPLPKWINRLASVGAKLPFVERTIPRVWLTPRTLEELNLTEDDIRNGSTANAASRLRNRRIRSAGLTRVHTYFTRNRAQDHSSSTVFQLMTSADTHSVAECPTRTAVDTNGYETQSEQCISKRPSSDNTTKPSCNNGRSKSKMETNGPPSSSSSVGSSIDGHLVKPKEVPPRKLRFPVSSLLATRRPSSVYIAPSPQLSRHPSAASSISGDGNLRSLAEVDLKSSRNLCTSGNPVKIRSDSVRLSQPISVDETICRLQPEPENPVLNTKNNSTRPVLHSVKSSPSTSLNCASSFRNGLLSRLQNLCGTAHTDDSIEKNPLYEPDRRTPWSAVYPDA